MPEHKLMRRLLMLPGLLYGGIMQLRNFLFDTGIFKSSASPIPVISIGNISAGGTGKTPLTDYIVRYYIDRGIRTAIISRGYKRSTKGVQLVSDGRTIFLNSRQAGDESLMLAWKNRAAVVVVAEKRLEGIAFILKHFQERLPEVIILDDAFQHRQLQRDLNIVLINASSPIWSDRMLPAGNLREPAANIRRADLAVISKLSADENGEAIAAPLRKQHIPVMTSGIRSGKLIPFQTGGKNPSGQLHSETTCCFAVAGIANPDSFLRSLHQSGLVVSMHAFFKDHEEFPPRKLRDIITKARLHNLAVVTTEKDYYRIVGNRELMDIVSQAACYYLTIEPDIVEGKELLETMLDNVLKTRRTIR